MDPDAKKPQPERGDTDASLRKERESADTAMRKRRAGIEAIADEVLERARDQADAVIGTARDKADLAMRDPDSGAHAQVAVDRERAREDDEIQNERALADEALRRERIEMGQTLARLLPLERQRTDRNLLSERARSDDQLAHRDDFLGMVSHDLRNLLSGVVFDASALGNRSPDTEDGRRTIETVARIQRYAARMSGLIGDLVDVVSIDAGKFAVHPEKGDAAALLREVAEAFTATASEQGVILQAEPEGSSLITEFDHDRILQVLANIVSNALRFTSRGGRILVRAEEVGGEVRFSVTDTGVGIRENLLESIFERFWQVGTNNQHGLGLGLYISKCLVAAHGGRIWAESSIGEGSTFYFTMPRTQASVAT